MPRRCCIQRAAKMWDIPEDAVTWEDGYAKPAGANAGNFPPLSLKEIAAAAANTGGPIAGHNEFVADGAGVSFATHICDVEVDPETGATKVLRYTVIQDAGKAIHPSYVEGQYQGGAAQGIGWALNEEYVYGKDGRLQNAGFLDYRIPVCSDLPMIDTVILEIPNPNHPYGVRGVGETSIVPPLAAIANAVSNAAGVRMTHIPMSPPRILKALDRQASESSTDGQCRAVGGAQAGRRRRGVRRQSRRATSANCSASSKAEYPGLETASRARHRGLDQRHAFTAIRGARRSRRMPKSISCRASPAGDASSEACPNIHLPPVLRRVRKSSFWAPALAASPLPRRYATRRSM